MMRTGVRTALRASALSQTLPRSNAITKSYLNAQVSTVTTSSQAFQNSNHFHHQYANHSMRPLSRHYTIQSIPITSPKTSKAQQHKLFQPLFFSGIFGGVFTFFGASWLLSSDEKTTVKITEDHKEQLKDVSPTYTNSEAEQYMTNSISYKETSLGFLNYCTRKPYFIFSETNEMRKISYREEILWTIRDIKDGVLFLSRWFSRRFSSLQEDEEEEDRMISLPFLTFFTVFFLDLSTSRLRRIGRHIAGLYTN